MGDRFSFRFRARKNKNNKTAKMANAMDVDSVSDVSVVSEQGEHDRITEVVYKDLLKTASQGGEGFSNFVLPRQYTESVIVFLYTEKGVIVLRRPNENVVSFVGAELGSVLKPGQRFIKLGEALFNVLAKEIGGTSAQDIKTLVDTARVVGVVSNVSRIGSLEPRLQALVGINVPHNVLNLIPSGKYAIEDGSGLPKVGVLHWETLKNTTAKKGDMATVYDRAGNVAFRTELRNHIIFTIPYQSVQEAFAAASA